MRSKIPLLLLALIGVVVGHSDDFDPWLLGLSVDSAVPIVQKFLARMTRSIESKDTAVIAGLFHPGFVFKGCTRTLNKNEMIAHLSGIPAGTKVSFDLGHIQDFGDNIGFSVVGNGVGVTVIDAVLLLSKYNQKLVYGYATCPMSRFTVGSNNPSDYYLI